MTLCLCGETAFSTQSSDDLERFHHRDMEIAQRIAEVFV